MNEFFALFSNHTFCVVALGSTLLGMMTGGLGCFAVLRKESLLGDCIAHSALPGVILAFLWTGEKNLPILLLGGGITGLLGCLLIVVLSRNSTLKLDSILAMVLAVFFGGAMVLLTISKKIPNGNQGGLERFIYGQAAAMLKSDVVLIAVTAVFCLVMVVLFWKQFKLLCFDPEFAQTLGYPVKYMQLFLSFLLVLSILMGLQTVGAILMSAMLVAPAIAAKRWVHSLGHMVILAAIFGGISGFLGTVASSLASSLPTGAVIVVIVSSIALFSLCFGTNRGIMTQKKEQKEMSLCPPPSKFK